MNMPAARLHVCFSLTGLLHGIAEAPDIAICGIASDTRELAHGYLFLACAGIRSHGLDYADQAAAAGAVAIAYDATTATSLPDVGIPLVPVEHLRARLGDIANRFFDDYIPSRFETYYEYAPNVIVEDNGSGFMVDDAFATTSRNTIGLSSIRDRLEMLGGELTIQSNLGQGTRAEFFVPISDAREVDAA